MRVLYSTRPFLGHFHPFVPLGRELVRRRHAVAVASDEQLIPAVESAGFSWLPAGMHPSAAADRLGDTDLDLDLDYGIEVIRAKVDDLLEVLITWYRPDIVIREPTDLAAALATEIAGSPCLTLGVGHFIPAESWDFLARDSLTALRADLGLPPDPELHSLFRGLYLDVVPPSWQRFDPTVPDGLWRIGYQPWDTAAGDDVVTDLDPEQTNVLVTFGTVYNDHVDVFDTCIAAFDDDADITVVATTGTAGPPPIAESPRLKVFDYIPLSQVLPSCRAMVCHGGFNTVMAALTAGVPFVVIPMGSDHYYNAELCEERGVGIALDVDGLTPDAVRAAVGKLIEDPSYARNAVRIRNQIRGLPSWRTVGVVLEEIVGMRGAASGAW